MEASFNGMLRTILILVVIWLVLRMVIRSRQPSAGQGPVQRGGFHTQQQQRPRGEVRIERIDPAGRTASQGPGTVQDADFEEVD